MCISKTLSKTTFAHCINALHAVEDFEQGMLQITRGIQTKYPAFYCDIGTAIYPNCSEQVIELLEELMGDDDGIICRFCYDIDFGKGWYPGYYCETDPVTGDIKDIRLDTIDALYDYLIQKSSKSSSDKGNVSITNNNANM